MCDKIVYEGTKTLEKTGLLEKHPAAVKGKMHVDHISAVVPLEGFPNTEWCWNIFINNLFCSEEGLQLICAECHDEKTRKENEIRKAYRAANKTAKKS